MMKKIPVGISSCLLGEDVRFDGGHKRDAYITGTLSRYFEFHPLCPEVGIGLGIPRPPIRPVQNEGEIRCVGIKDPCADVTTGPVGATDFVNVPLAALSRDEYSRHIPPIFHSAKILM